MAVILEHFYHLIVIRSELRKKQNTNTMTSTSRDNTRTCLAMVSLSETEKRNAKILGSAIWWIPDAPRNGLRSEPGDSLVRDAVGQYAGPIECERFALLLQSDTSRYFVPCGGRGLGTAVSSQRRLPPPRVAFWRQNLRDNGSPPLIGPITNAAQFLTTTITTTITLIIIATVVLRKQCRYYTSLGPTKSGRRQCDRTD